MKLITVLTTLDNLAVHPGECLTVFLHDKTQIVQVELRVTAEGKAEVFAGLNVQEFKKWYVAK